MQVCAGTVIFYIKRTLQRLLYFRNQTLSRANARYFEHHNFRMHQRPLQGTACVTRACRRATLSLRTRGTLSGRNRLTLRCSKSVTSTSLQARLLHNFVFGEKELRSHGVVIDAGVWVLFLGQRGYTPRLFERIQGIGILFFGPKGGTHPIVLHGW